MRRLLQRHEFYVILAILILTIIITSLNPNFLCLENLFDMLKSYSFMGIMAIGVLVVLISGGIDISFTAVATVSQYIMAVLIIKYTGNIVLAFSISIIIGVILGLLNASIIYYFNIPTIIVTIGTLNIFYGLLVVFSGGRWIYTLPQWFARFAEIRIFTLLNSNGNPYGLSIITAIWIAVTVIAAFILRFTTLGRSLYAVGGCGFNKSPAERAGISIFRVQLFVYSFMGFIAGIAGVVQALLVQTVAPNSMVGKELNVIAAVIIGGASISGGTGSITGTILGVILLAVLSNGLTLMRVPSYWYDVVIGLVILTSVSVSAMQQKRKVQRAIAIEED
ncbi:MAG: ABC transporter permease [Spirochaetes bacterium]|nr:MAG: ABC transporter permease [Spirochaetota bacterium]RKX92759.1 MAG: ABC transporter permease [Spirochaetota bacterium]